MGAAMNRKLATESTMLPVSNSSPWVPPVTQIRPTMFSPANANATGMPDMSSRTSSVKPMIRTAHHSMA